MAKNKRSEGAKFVRWFKPLMEVMSELGTASADEVINKIAEIENLDDEFITKCYPKSGGNVFKTEVWFSRQYLTWEGYLSTPSRSMWSLTDLGAVKAKNFTDTDAVTIYRKWVDINSKLQKDKPVKTSSQEKELKNDIADDTIESEESNATLLDIIKGISPTGFEKLCGELLRRYNFENVDITQRSRDGGIDGFATLKINPFVNYRIAFQCKRYEGSVSLDEVKTFCYSAKKYDRMLFITTGTFSKETRKIEKEEATLELIDGEKLVKMFEDIELGVTAEVTYIPDLSYFERFL